MVQSDSNFRADRMPLTLAAALILSFLIATGGPVVNLRVSMGNIITGSLITTLFDHDYGPGDLLESLYGEYYYWVTNNHETSVMATAQMTCYRVSMGNNMTSSLITTRLRLWPRGSQVTNAHNVWETFHVSSDAVCGLFCLSCVWLILSFLYGAFELLSH